MKEIFISIDVEKDLHTGKYNSLKALPDFMKLLKKYNAKATLFITCDCLKKNPSIFRKIKAEGHELSLHGYKHERVDTLTIKEKHENIEKSLKCFKKYLNLEPSGFRAPQHSIDNETMLILKKSNIKYDSSISPWNFYHLIFFWKIHIKFSHNLTSMKVHKRKGILEIPISSFILPFSSFTLRILPPSLLKAFFSFISSYKYPVFLMHSWDLIEIPNSKLYNLCPKDKFMRKFELMLSFFSKRRFSTLSMIKANQD